MRFDKATNCTGHAHLYALKHLSRLIAAGYEVVVVAPDVFSYSGLATSVLSGRYPPGQDIVDVAALV
jgi:NADH dehydrogenase FAD-containing subunit